jgi:EAL domain-containing protein (putative c-di-GMP-specific phosphodiesterase class I)
MTLAPASLSYLKKFPLDRLKIDLSFVSEFQVDSDDAAIVGSTIALTKLLAYRSSPKALRTARPPIY